MRRFYEQTLKLPLHRELSPGWIEFRIGSAILALATPGGRFNDPAPPVGALSLQLAFRVAPHEVASVCPDARFSRRQGSRRAHGPGVWSPDIVLSRP